MGIKFRARKHFADTFNQVFMAGQFKRRKIDRYGQLAITRIAPYLGLMAGPVQYPFANISNDAHAFSHRDKINRADLPA